MVVMRPDVAAGALLSRDGGVPVARLVELTSASEFTPLLECNDGRLRLSDASLRKLAAFRTSKPTARFVVLTVSCNGEVTVMMRSAYEMCCCFGSSRLGARVRAVAARAEAQPALALVIVVCGDSTTESFIFLQALPDCGLCSS